MFATRHNRKARLSDNGISLSQSCRGSSEIHLQNDSTISPNYSGYLYRSAILLRKKDSATSVTETPLKITIGENTSSKLEVARTFSITEERQSTHGRHTSSCNQIHVYLQSVTMSVPFAKRSLEQWFKCIVCVVICVISTIQST